jgi:hypothetical protein
MRSICQSVTSLLLNSGGKYCHIEGRLEVDSSVEASARQAVGWIDCNAIGLVHDYLIANDAIPYSQPPQLEKCPKPAQINQVVQHRLPVGPDRFRQLALSADGQVDVGRQELSVQDRLGLLTWDKRIVDVAEKGDVTSEARFSRHVSRPLLHVGLTGTP